jgi:hypothetical protein
MPFASRRVMLLALMSTVAIGRGMPRQIQTGSVSPAGSAVKLELRLGDGRTQFHLGEIVPVELIFTSEESREFSIFNPECEGRTTYQFHIEPPEFSDRLVEADAGLFGYFIDTCGHGGSLAVNLKDSPIHARQILNEWFRIDKPGQYRVSVTSFRFSVSSNTVELVILPSDPEWEKAELERADELIRFPKEKPEHDQGCQIVRFLQTDAATTELIKRYVQNDCTANVEAAIIGATDRGSVLRQLEDGIAAPNVPISPSYLRTLSIVSLYQQHPDWYPNWIKQSDNQKTLEAEPKSRLWSQKSAIPSEELRYMQLVNSSLPRKTAQARAATLEGLLLVSKSLTSGPNALEIPAAIASAVREQLPETFSQLSGFQQGLVLSSLWPEVKAVAFIPVLKAIVDSNPPNPPRAIALRRLYELSPADGREAILRELSAAHPRVSIDVLGLLPDKELPEFDRMALRRLRTEIENKEYPPGASDYIERYASGAIAENLQGLINAEPQLVYESVGAAECQQQANLLAYFLRVRPSLGAEMLQKSMREPRKPNGCHTELLRRLVDRHMSAEVESVSLAALEDPEPRVVQSALFVLKQYGSVKAKDSLWQHFRIWSAAWQPRAKALELPDEREQIATEGAYFETLSAPYGWITSVEDLRALRTLCVSRQCVENADRAINYWPQGALQIIVSEPQGDEFNQKVGIANYFSVMGTIDRLKNKMSQYPKSSIFTIESSYNSRNTVQRIYDELKPWVTEQGFGLQVHRP